MKPILGNLFVFLRRHPRTGSPISVKPPPENSDGLTGNPTCAISRSGDNRNDCRGFTDWLVGYDSASLQLYRNESLG
ncbi:hypothetical protein V6N13_000515 [Hibiscus sabdariffa]